MNMNKIESCGIRIQKALNIRQMKQSELSKLANVPKSSLSLYIKGVYEPKQDKIYAMAEVLGVADTWLMGYDVPMKRFITTSITSIELTENEKAMLDLFRQIPRKQQLILMQLVRDGLKNRE
jgi:transcriptional regulator with XRE-family HTH domain